MPLLFAAALALVLSIASPAVAQRPDLTALSSTFEHIAGGAHGKVGVSLIHVESGVTIDIRGDERFPMASVVKLPIAIEVLKQVAEGRLALDREISLAASDIRPCCTLERRWARGPVSQTVLELLTLSIVESDNTAADVLLRLVRGPATVQRRLHKLGFSHIRIDRSEGQLLLDMAGVTGAPPEDEWTIELQRQLVAAADRTTVSRGREQYLTDPRDTATPSETAQLLGRLQLRDILPEAETRLLLDLMTQTKTGSGRIKARLPKDTPVAHKTGTTAIVINDAGIITLPADSKVPGHLALAVYVAGGSSIRRMERAVADLSAAAFEFFTGQQLKPPAPPRRRRAK